VRHLLSGCVSEYDVLQCNRSCSSGFCSVEEFTCPCGKEIAADNQVNGMGFRGEVSFAENSVVL
jgi:hypothetical protein